MARAGEQVDGVVAGHGEGNLELLGQVGPAVKRLDRVASDDAFAVVVGAHLVEVELANVALPIFREVRLLAVEPQLDERVGHRLEQVGDSS